MDLKKNRPVAIWLFIGAGMIIIQVLLGGITRLTGSGLSITEWKPILGALPPMNQHDWMIAFEKYKQIAQYKYIHNYFDLQDFKSIYFWEWLHRNWARFMGVVFIVPFVYFIYKRKIDRSMLWPMVVLFILGALQGAIGWIMVASGVGTDLVYVSHIRLATHFIAALILLVYVIWFAMKISVPDFKKARIPVVKNFTLLLLAILTVQLIYGAFMAGTHAAKSAITWPSINGQFAPDMSDGGLFHNLLAIQFIHRGLAYIITALIILYTAMLYRQIKSLTIYKLRNWPLIITLTQVLLGVLTLVNYLAPSKIWLAITHQFVGILLLICLEVTYFYSAKRIR
ncbi:COX15/CtaA family protein [Niabella ginsengisoli]|uniref:COX15/CtaA family protein n=1 Tax=Niabella ginsengisoli TaxID=522298 RepID=A0ABS9SPM7_9BACT|nr:COX15/CtaA family protein [Niabella ginsengisoli]MCH5600201.1 COX15/CtaA family protein [Niabella ginsengisoli]